MNHLLHILGVRKEFQQLFFANEYRTLAGRANAWVLLLSAILFLTLLALGFAIGGMKVLSQRMDDPFTNWVDLQISRSVSDDDIRDIRRTFSAQAMKDSFLLKDVSEYVVWREQFVDVASGALYYRKGRTVDLEGELLQKILDAKGGNVLSGTALPLADTAVALPPCGLVVTVQMLEGLGYEAPFSQKKIQMDLDGRRIYLDLIAVVKSLPNLCDFACSPHLFNLLTQPADETGFIAAEGSSNILRFLSGEGDKGKVAAWAGGQLGTAVFNNLKQSDYTLNERQPSYLYEAVLNDFLDETARTGLLGKLQAGAAFEVLPFVETSCNDQYGHIANPYYMAFNFGRLDRVRAFRQFMQERYGIEISMDQVEAKENFALVSRLTLFMAVVLFVFGVGSIVSFINSLLRTHLEKIKPNLGTFKAFGLSNGFLKNIYGKIVLFFLSLATVLAAAGVLLVFFIEKMLSGTGYLDVADYRLLGACAFILLAGLLLTQWTIRRTLLDSPGNLIYGREE
ncbi:MAG: hypothetical protein R2830_22560 [Saprospiraceae bacterium]